MKRFVQFGAGNIGRSFVARLFAQAGYGVTFVDVNRSLVDEINRRGRYSVTVKQQDEPDRALWVESVNALPFDDRAAVVGAVAEASCLGTAVGASAVGNLYEPLAAGLLERVRRAARDPNSHLVPLNLIIAENLRDAAAHFRAGLSRHLPRELDLDHLIGLVETSIGKMVPLLSERDRRADPLVLFTEAYDSLIVARRGFQGAIPSVPGLLPVENIGAYVDRKLFIHNLGHAACAYAASLLAPSTRLLADAVCIPSVESRTQRSMEQMADVLAKVYPDSFTRETLQEHVQDLLFRFHNRALGDTVYRVGRDLPRKLGRDERIVGAMRLAQSAGMPYDSIVEVFCSALSFSAVDESGAMFPADDAFLRRYFGEPGRTLGPLHARAPGALPTPAQIDVVLAEVCGLSNADPVDVAVRRAVIRRAER